MFYYNLVFACRHCIRGHRTNICTHGFEDLWALKKKGRPTGSTTSRQRQPGVDPTNPDIKSLKDPNLPAFYARIMNNKKLRSLYFHQHEPTEAPKSKPKRVSSPAQAQPQTESDRPLQDSEIRRWMELCGITLSTDGTLVKATGQQLPPSRLPAPEPSAARPPVVAFSDVVGFPYTIPNLATPPPPLASYARNEDHFEYHSPEIVEVPATIDPLLLTLPSDANQIMNDVYSTEYQTFYPTDLTSTANQPALETNISAPPLPASIEDDLKSLFNGTWTSAALNGLEFTLPGDMDHSMNDVDFADCQAYLTTDLTSAADQPAPKTIMTRSGPLDDDLDYLFNDTTEASATLNRFESVFPSDMNQFGMDDVHTTDFQALYPTALATMADQPTPVSSNVDLKGNLGDANSVAKLAEEIDRFLQCDVGDIDIDLSPYLVDIDSMVFSDASITSISTEPTLSTIPTASFTFGTLPPSKPPSAGTEMEISNFALFQGTSS
jgi:hypothetical protein